MKPTQVLTGADERCRDHVGGRLRIQVERARDDDRRRDETSKHRKRMLQAARSSKEERKLRVEGVEWGCSPLPVVLPGKSGHAKPCIVVVPEPAASCRQLSLSLLDATADIPNVPCVLQGHRRG